MINFVYIADMKSLWKLTTVIILLLLSTPSLMAIKHVEWSIKAAEQKGEYIDVTYVASINSSWGLFGTDLPSGGPNPTRVVLESCVGAVQNSEIESLSTGVNRYSSLFDLVLTQFYNQATFKQRYAITSYPVKISGYITYQASNGVTCIPPAEHRFNISIKGEDTSKSSQQKLSQHNSTNGNKTHIASIKKWDSIEKEIKELSLLYGEDVLTPMHLLKQGFSSGISTLINPSIWAILLISITYFRRKIISRKRLIFRTLLYSLIVIILYPLIGVAICKAFGVESFSRIPSNPYINLIMFIFMLLFVWLLFGNLRWVYIVKNSISKRILHLICIVLIVTLYSTGSYIGQLLKESVELGDIFGPFITLLGFILAYTSVMALLIIIINWHKESPKILYRTTICNRVVGFFVLAHSLTYLSYIDTTLGYNLINRYVFIVALISIWGVFGLYMLRVFKLENDKFIESDKVTMSRLLVAIMGFGFCIYLIPGLWGAPLNNISTLIPPIYTQEFNLYNSTEHKIYNDYDKGVRYAKVVDKPILLTFGATNDAESKKMEATIWSFSLIRDIINDKFVIISLKVDSKESLPTKKIVIINKRTESVSTYGELWSALQHERFGSSTQPYHIILSPTEEPLTAPIINGATSVKGYLQFLYRGLNNFNNNE